MVLMLHKTRELLIKQRTMNVNALRGHLAEFGIIAAKGIGRIDELVELAESDTALPDAARAAVKILAGQIADLDKSLDSIEEKIAAAHEASEMSRLLVEIPGIGKLSLGDRGEPTGAWCVQIGARFFRLAWPCAAAKLERRQANAWGHHQKGQPVLKETACLGGDLAPQGRA